MEKELAQLRAERQQAIAILSKAMDHIFPTGKMSPVDWAAIEALAVLQHECFVCNYQKPAHDSECPNQGH